MSRELVLDGDSEVRPASARWAAPPCCSGGPARGSLPADQSTQKLLGHEQVLSLLSAVLFRALPGLFVAEPGSHNPSAGLS